MRAVGGAPRFCDGNGSLQAVLVTKENAESFTAENNPLRATRQLVNYANNSGHTINDLTITDKASEAGVKDFAAYLDTATLTADTDGNPDTYRLTGEARSEIIGYCAAMLENERYPANWELWDNTKLVGAMYAKQWTENVIPNADGSNSINPAYDTRAEIEKALNDLVCNGDGITKEVEMEAITEKLIYGYDGHPSWIPMMAAAGLNLSDYI
jgi:hypothetical protein